AGSYPALYLSGMRVLEVLKGKVIRKRSDGWGRNVLVAVQFSLSILMIVAVLVIFRQMDFVQSTHLGYDRDNLVYFQREGKLMEGGNTFLEEVLNIPGVKDATMSGFYIGGMNSTGGVGWPEKTDEDQLQFWEVDAGPGLIEMMGIEVIEGRSFSGDLSSDSTGIIFNETAIKAMGLENPIGTRVFHYKGFKKIIGVVKDFHLESLHQPVQPTLFLYDPTESPFIMAKLQKGAEKNALEAMEDVFNEFNPGFPFEPKFVDQDYQAQYAAEQRVGALSAYAAGFAILISCLGLFGLASFSAERRAKEIGIRKILGSGIGGIIRLLMMDFLKVILVAVVVALPLSYFVAQGWLEGFAYRIPLEWWFFASAGVAALIVAALTISAQTWKAAVTNPVQSLRDE
ncbi:MAG: FtsX-like permease family protein, partial [Bacteroidota bacterium]